MGIVGWLLVVLVPCAVFAGWRYIAYPGGWAYAFGSAYAQDRRVLGSARRTVWGLKLRARRELTAAKGGASGARARYGRRVRAAELELEAVRNPGPGEVLDGMGVLILHQHVLRAGAEEFPLARLRIRADHSRRRSHLYLTRPDGRVRQEVLPGDQYDEETVRTFVVAVKNAVAAENKAQRQRQARIAKAEAALERARTDTAAHEEADRRLAEVVERHRANPELDAARRRLEQARESWQDLTGSRPR
ncbi:hypothetical protein [Streptacidiphilus cavernicola]|uniref:Uncharacterized protein n=1 Tax=Streptacidiphilus cavernicola TaxID=3342716 RepID=A0ABV6VWA5_9ACTN